MSNFDEILMILEKYENPAIKGAPDHLISYHNSREFHTIDILPKVCHKSSLRPKLFPESTYFVSIPGDIWGAPGDIWGANYIPKGSKMDVYELVRGPFAWVALIIFVAGCLFRIISTIISGKKEPALYPSTSINDAVRSILHGLIPFGSTYMRRQPLFTFVTIGFHLCVIILPLFLLAHIVLWYESWQILWWSLPDLLADLMAIWVILACIFFLARRWIVPEVKQVTRLTDVLLLVIILLTFLTGFLSYHQWGSYRPILILHVLAGEILLIAIPFSKLGHMLFFVFSRAYMGAEFGKVLKAREW